MDDLERYGSDKQAWANGKGSTTRWFQGLSKLKNQRLANKDIQAAIQYMLAWE